MRQTMRLASIAILAAALCVCLASQERGMAAESTEPALIPVQPEVIAAREKSLNQAAPQGGKLVAYLDCGSQRQSTTTFLIISAKRERGSEGAERPDDFRPSLTLRTYDGRPAKPCQTSQRNDATSTIIGERS